MTGKIHSTGISLVITYISRAQHQNQDTNISSIDSSYSGFTCICVWICIYIHIYTQIYVCAQSLSHVQLFVTLWIVAHQAPLYTGFFWQEYWSGLPFPSPGDLPMQGSDTHLLHLQWADSLPPSHLGSPICVCSFIWFYHIHKFM